MVNLQRLVVDIRLAEVGRDSREYERRGDREHESRAQPAARPRARRVARPVRRNVARRARRARQRAQRVQLGLRRQEPRYLHALRTD